MHVMVDIETLGTSERAVVLSIGAVKFDLNQVWSVERLQKDTLYCVLDLEHQNLLKREIDPETVAWWMRQSEEAKEVFRSTQTSIDDSLTALSNFVKSPDAHEVWANSPSFDCKILSNLNAEIEKSKYPSVAELFDFRLERDFRTVLALAKNKGFKVEWPEGSTGHNALSDAVSQAYVLQRAHAFLIAGDVRYG